MTIIREGPGLGDLVMCLGAIQGWRRDVPDEIIQVVASEPILQILREHPAIDVLGTREQIEIDDRRDTVFRLSDPCPAARREHGCGRNVWTGRIDLFAEACGDVAPELPRLYLRDDERQWALDWIAGPKGVPGDGPLVALVLRCAEPWRNVSNNRMLVDALHEIGCRVVTIDHEQAIARVPGTVGLSIRQTASVIAAADIVVSPDTGWLHVAGALQRPIFGLFGSVDPGVRQRPWLVPGGWWTGACPHGKQPCWYDICGSRDETPPCLEIYPEAVELIAGAIGKAVGAGGRRAEVGGQRSEVGGRRSEDQE